jgi:UDP-glucose 4-epimerase
VPDQPINVTLSSCDGRRVLILGGGFIGAATTSALVSRGANVTVLTRSEPPAWRRPLLAGATVVIGDAGRMDTLASLLAGVDEVVYALGSSTPVESEMDPAGDISSVLPPLVRVLELIRLQPSTRLTFMSSGGTVYGNSGELPLKEDAPTRPVSSYGILKLACENYIAMYSDVHAVPARVLRVSNPYGPGQSWAHGQGLVARLMHCAGTGETATLFGWGKAVRDYLHIDDLATAVARAVTCDELPPVVNVGSGVGHRSVEVARLIREITARDFEIRLDLPRGYDVDANILDVSVATRHLGLKARDLRTGLRDMWSAQDPTLTLVERTATFGASGGQRG